MVNNGMTKKEHFVPRSYLAGFEVESGFYGLSLANGYMFPTRPADACTQRYLYETRCQHVSSDSCSGPDQFVDPNAIEHAISIMESRFIRAIRDVDAHCAELSLTRSALIDRTNDILEFALHVIIRNPRAVDDLTDIVREGLGEHLTKKAVYKAAQIGRVEEVEALEKEIAKRFFLLDDDEGWFLKSVGAEWRNCKRLIFVAPPDRSFIVSDSPVCGFGSDDDLLVVLLPVSMNAAIVYFSKEASEAGCILASADSNDVDSLNAMQLVSRPPRNYLYGPDGEYLSRLYEDHNAGRLLYANLLSLAEGC